MTSAPFRLPHPVSHRRVAEALLIALLAALAGGFVLAGGLGDDTSNVTVGSGTVVSEERTLPAFSAVDLAGTSALTVRAGERQRVAVRTDDNLLEEVTTNVRHGELVIGDGPGSFRTSGMTTEVTVPYLSAISLSGTGAIAVHAVDAERFAVKLTGTGTITVDGRADWLRADLRGSGTIDLAGMNARHVTSTVLGTGTIVRR